MTRKLLLPALLITIFTATQTFAQVQEGAFTASLFEGGYTFDDKQHLKTEVAHGVRLGYHLTSNWGIEGQLTYVPLKSTRATIQTEGEQYGLSGNLLYHFLPESQVVPYVVLGGGLSERKNYFNSNTDATLDYGAGMHYFISDRVSLRGDVRNILSFHSSTRGQGDHWSNYEYTAGLTFQFGGTRPAAPAPAMAKPAALTEAQLPETEKPQLPEPQPAQARALPATPSTSSDANAPAATVAQRAAPVTTPRPVAVVPVAQLAGTTEDSTGCKVSTVANVVIGSNGVEIISDLDIETYKVFKLSAPTRLVIDIFCATYGTDGKTLKFAVNRKGISSLRVGTHPGKMRVVLDSPLAKFPGYRLEKTERGLNLLFNDK